jgi:drug/metabolite transporter (DMT)-like permease
MIKNRKSLLEYSADISLLLAALCWGSTFIIVKNTINEIPVFSFLYIRFTLAFIFLSVFLIIRYKNLHLKAILAGFVLGFLIYLIYAFQTVALLYTKASIAAFITGSFIIFTPVLSLFILKKKPYKTSVYSVIITFLGLFLITFKVNDISLSISDLFLLINAFFVALHIIFIDKYSRKYDIHILTALQCFFMAILSFITAIILKEPFLQLEITPYVVFSLLYTSIFATAIAFLIQIGMQRFTTPTKTAIMFSVEPLSAPFFAYFISGETLTSIQYSGAFLIIIGILIAEIGTSKKYKNASH